MTPLAEWQNFYVVMGSAAGALTGLQFVVMALISDMPMANSEIGTAQAFATPTIVHFSSVLMLSAVLVAPWHGLVLATTLCSIAGLAGLIYTLVIGRRFRNQTAYHPVLEDWIFHLVLPLIAYGTIAASTWSSRHAVRGALFSIAAAALLLLFIGIHNAWDNVLYLVFVKKQNAQ